MMQRLIEGQCFTRRDIAALFGGNARAFLPRVNGGDIVAGCFDPEMNPRVPYEILVHNAPNAILNAQRFLEQSRTTGTPPYEGGEAADAFFASDDGMVLSPHSAVRTPHSAVPVFLRRAPNVWEYVGRYRAVRYSEDPDQVSIRIYEIRPRIYERHAREYGQIRGILFLEEA
jgi:hypothetical protein